MHANFFGHFLDHHGLKLIDALVQKVPLTANDRHTDFKDSLPSLFQYS